MNVAEEVGLDLMGLVAQSSHESSDAATVVGASVQHTTGRCVGNQHVGLCVERSLDDLVEGVSLTVPLTHHVRNLTATSMPSVVTSWALPPASLIAAARLT